jgi:hypothetical protein
LRLFIERYMGSRADITFYLPTKQFYHFPTSKLSQNLCGDFSLSSYLSRKPISSSILTRLRFCLYVRRKKVQKGVESRRKATRKRNLAKKDWRYDSWNSSEADCESREGTFGCGKSYN